MKKFKVLELRTDLTPPSFYVRSKAFKKQEKAEALAAELSEKNPDNTYTVVTIWGGE